MAFPLEDCATGLVTRELSPGDVFCIDSTSTLSTGVGDIVGDIDSVANGNSLSVVIVVVVGVDAVVDAVDEFPALASTYSCGI